MRPGAGRRRFRGLANLLRLVGDLVSRPRWWARKTSDLRGDRPLPLVCLIGEGGSGVLDGLAEGLAQGPVAPPHALVQANAALAVDGTGPGPVLPLLEVLRQALRLPVYGGTKRPRFRHYQLVDWLTRREVGQARQRDETYSTRQALRAWHTRGREQPPLGGDAAGDSLWLRLLTVVPDVLRLVRFGFWRTFGEPRWLMRQRFMMPGHSTRFLEFAERLATDRRGGESDQQVEKLLVHAFLQDLREEYRPRRLRLRRWRRTTYVTALLDGVSRENGGWKLLRLVNDVRNESTEHDPLLVVATAPRLGDDLPADTKVNPVDHAGDAWREWERELPVGRQKLRPYARFLFLAVPGTADNAHSEDDGAWGAWDRRSWPGVPLLARPWVAVAAVGALVGALVLAVGVPLFTARVNGCLPVTLDPGVVVEWSAGECIGYSDDASQVFGADARLRRAQALVFASNDDAERLAEDTGRPLVTLVYFADLSRAKASPGTDASLAEELEGLLIQQRSLNRETFDRPLLRVVVANGGEAMDQARTVVDDMLLPLLADDPSVLGVIGMGLTAPSTEDAIRALGDQGVPVMATTLTGTVLPELSPTYFQLVPGNRVQAAAVVAYAVQNAKAKVVVYHPPLTDNYLTTLVSETRDAAAKAGLQYVDEGWSAQVGDVTAVCEADAVLFYAGRENAFGNFLRKVVEECDRAGRPRPTIIGDDTVSRFMAQASVRDDNALANQPALFVSMAPHVVLARGDCAGPTPTPGAPLAGDPPLETFCRGYRSLVKEATAEGFPEPPWPGERVGLAYDAAGLFLQALQFNQRRRPEAQTEYQAQRPAIAAELRMMPLYKGATGAVDLQRSPTGQQRAIALVEITDIADPTALPLCRFAFSEAGEQSCG
ncbi:hypothetical protein BJP25_19645 [Actinokineospora bangkokensis]|uniref:Leucine-binding protein domain-containing protein n=1 Tax=Actinokineospora bangkokensis TaxID=1193682 RepID=A0A1Q9LLC3_9PSEU|nr:hypothetical protein BJP25_19645 [Actinokineospora bangkokensis]